MTIARLRYENRAGAGLRLKLLVSSGDLRLAGLKKFPLAYFLPLCALRGFFDPSSQMI
jgi:hypothetical protein